MLDIRSCFSMLLAATFFLSGCHHDTAEDFVGKWEIWSIDGAPTAVAPPEVVEMPGFSSGQVTLSEGEVRTESRTLHRVLDILADGEYLDVHVQEQTFVASARAVRAFGRTPVGTDAVREVQPPDTSRVLGEWTLENDTLRLTLDRDQAVQQVIASLRGLYPQASEELLAATLDSTIADIELPNRLVAVREGDRLVGLGPDGRTWVFRRQVP